MNKTSQSSEGVKNVIKLSYPLILMWVSTTVMMFVDRIFLANYSIAALGAAVNAGTIVWGLAYALQFFCEMSQVVVAQYRGAKLFERQSYPVWQMLWVSIFSIGIYVFLAFFGGELFFKKGSIQTEYFQSLIIFGPMFGVIGACSAYFIGRGENRIVMITAALGNGINLILDYIMIFGVSGYLKPMGAKGAAIATGIGFCVQALTLLFVFLKRTHFKVIPFSKKEFKRCLRAGLAPALFMGAELVGWGLFFTILKMTSFHHLAIASICQSLTPLLACVGIGLQKVISTISGELIGSQNMHRIPKLFKSGMKILVGYMLIIFTFVALFPQLIAKLFGGSSSAIEIGGDFQSELLWGLLLSCGYLLFGGFRNLLTGVLSAAGDSRFLMPAGVMSVWALLILPTYFFVYIQEGTVNLPQFLLVLYGLVVCSIYFTRYRFGKWREKALLID